MGAKRGTCPPLSHQLHTFQPGPSHPYPPPGLLGEGGAETLSQGRERPFQGAAHRAGGYPTALELDKVMRDALVDLPPIRPGAIPASPSCPLKPMRCGHLVLQRLPPLPPSCAAAIGELAERPGPPLPGLSLLFPGLWRGSGEAELKQLGAESWGPL